MPRNTTKKETMPRSLGELKRLADSDPVWAKRMIDGANNLGGDCRTVEAAWLSLCDNASAIEFEGIEGDAEQTVLDEVLFLID